MGQRRLSFVSVGPGGKPLAVGFNSCAFPHGGCLSLYVSYVYFLSSLASCCMELASLAYCCMQLAPHLPHQLALVTRLLGLARQANVAVIQSRIEMLQRKAKNQCRCTSGSVQQKCRTQ